MPAHLVQDRSQIIGTHMFHQRYGNRATTKETGLGGDPANDDEHLNPEETKIFNNAQTSKYVQAKMMRNRCIGRFKHFTASFK